MALPRYALVVCCVLISLCSSLCAVNAKCTFDTFTAPAGYTLNSVLGIADDGTVVGQLIDNDSGNLVGFMRSASGDFTTYSAPQSSTTWIYAQNTAGMNSGTYLDEKLNVLGFTMENNNFNSIKYPGAASTWIFGVNHAGNLTGSYGGGADVKGFLLVNGNYTTIVDPGENTTYPVAIKDNNAVVGYAGSSSVSYGFLWQNGEFTAINYPKAKYGTVLNGINNDGIIVGNHISADRSFGFIYQNGKFENIVYPGSKYQIAGGINNSGVVAGQIYYTQTNNIGYTATCN